MINMFKNCIFDSSTFSKHMIKKACKNYKKYNSYDYFKKAYKHDTEHDVAKNVTILRIFYVNTECFSQNLFFKVISMQLY